jgi:hypothetical protein
MNFFDFASSIRSPMPHSFQAAMSALMVPHPGHEAQVKDEMARLPGNEAVILKLDRLEADLKEIRETINQGNREIEELRTGYEQLTSSMETLFGAIATE